MGFGDRRQAGLQQRVSPRRPFLFDRSVWDDPWAVADLFPAAEQDGGRNPQFGRLEPRGRLLAIQRQVYARAFPYEPAPAVFAEEFTPNGDWRITPRGVRWTYGVLTPPRVNGLGQSGQPAWALLPDAGYTGDVVTWLESPAFDFSALDESGYVFRVVFWADMAASDGLKLQVSVDGGETWADAPTNHSPSRTVPGLAEVYGGGSGGHGAAGGLPVQIESDIAGFEGQSDVRYRICFYSPYGSAGGNGVVLDALAVTAASAVLDFSVPPLDVAVGGPTFPVQVQVISGLDFLPIEGYADDVTLTLIDLDSTGATLVGTTVRAAVDGVANFPGLLIDIPGRYQLQASAPGQFGIITLISDEFFVTVPQTNHQRFGVTPLVVLGVEPMGGPRPGEYEARTETLAVSPFGAVALETVPLPPRAGQRVHDYEAHTVTRSVSPFGAAALELAPLDGLAGVRSTATPASGKVKRAVLTFGSTALEPTADQLFITAPLPRAHNLFAFGATALETTVVDPRPGPRHHTLYRRSVTLAPADFGVQPLDELAVVPQGIAIREPVPVPPVETTAHAEFGQVALELTPLDGLAGQREQVSIPPLNYNPFLQQGPALLVEEPVAGTAFDFSPPSAQPPVSAPHTGFGSQPLGLYPMAQQHDVSPPAPAVAGAPTHGQPSTDNSFQLYPLTEWASS